MGVTLTLHYFVKCFQVLILMLRNCIGSNNTTSNRWINKKRALVCLIEYYVYFLSIMEHKKKLKGRSINNISKTQRQSLMALKKSFSPGQLYKEVMKISFRISFMFCFAHSLEILHK